VEPPRDEPNLDTTPSVSPEPVKRARLSGATLAVVVIFYVILVGMCVSGLVIALVLMRNR
jgi:hypothetical protein